MLNKSTLLLIVPGLLSSAPALADNPASSFGERGSVVIALSQDFATGILDLLVPGPAAEAAYFVTSNLSIGLRLGAFWGTSYSPMVGTDSGTTFAFQVGPRVGYDIALGEYLSLWPQAGVDLRYVTSSSGNSNAASSNIKQLSLAASLPLVVHPTKGFFVGVGPRFSADVLNNASAGSVSQDITKAATLGLFAMVGGAF